MCMRAIFAPPPPPPPPLFYALMPLQASKQSLALTHTYYTEREREREREAGREGGNVRACVRERERERGGGGYKCIRTACVQSTVREVCTLSRTLQSACDQPNSPRFLFTFYRTRRVFTVLFCFFLLPLLCFFPSFCLYCTFFLFVVFTVFFSFCLLLLHVRFFSVAFSSVLCFVFPCIAFFVCFGLVCFFFLLEPRLSVLWTYLPSKITASLA